MHARDHLRDDHVGADIALLAVNADERCVAAAMLARRPAIGAFALHRLADGMLLIRQARSDGPPANQLPDWLAAGADPFGALQRLPLNGLPVAEEQLALGAPDGRLTAYSGPRCPPWSGVRQRAEMLCLTRRAVSPATAQAAVDAYAETPGSCADRLLQALLAAQYVEGNRRRMRSAALLLINGDGRTVDLRVDDHAEPLDELQRLLQVHRFHYAAGPQDALPLTPELTAELQRLLSAGGYLRSDINGVYDAPTFAALERWLQDEQLEQRFQPDAAIDRQVLDYLRRRRWR
jgi:uncharacterized Ntn-hydrolase superfamily protein